MKAGRVTTPDFPEYGRNAEGCEPVNSGHRDTFSLPDAELIAAAVNALPALLDAAERLAEVTAERDALAAIERVRALHVPQVVAVHESGPETWCPECGAHYPCPTIRAIDGDA